MVKNRQIAKMDQINRHIVSVVHNNANIANQELAEIVGLSPSACFQRYRALRDAGYFIGFHTELDLDRLCEHLIAYVEFTLKDNSVSGRKAFEKSILGTEEFMDCQRLTGDVDYICFTCCLNVEALNELCDGISKEPSLGVEKIRTRIVLDRTKFFFGYPLEKLKWLDE